MASLYAINTPGHGGIDPTTVARSRRGALVKLLERRGYTDVGELDDQGLEMLWTSIRESATAGKSFCVKVELNTVPGGDVTLGER